MLRYAARRVPSAVVVLLVASVIVFIVPRLAEGDAADILAGPDASPATRDAVRSDLGLDRNPVIQYAMWLRGLFTGNLGTSYIRKQPASEAIGTALGQTVTLTVAALLIALVLGGAAGIAMGAGRSRLLTRAVSSGVSLAFAVPPYVSGVLMVLLFAVTVRL